MHPVSLQINLAPVDYPFAKYILPHQLKVMAPLVGEVLLVVDLHKSKGRFAGSKWESNKDKLFDLLKVQAGLYANVRIAEVDYAEATIKKVSRYFFEREVISPLKDNRGGPYFSYLYALSETRHDVIFHLDSDILLMGEAKLWIEEALTSLQSPTYLAVSPAARPGYHGRDDDFDVFTTRFFLMDRSDLQNKLRRKLPGLDRVLNALIKGNPIYQAPERSIDSYMKKKGLKRREFSGSGNFVALHPATRSELFFDSLPGLIKMVEDGKYPDVQMQHFDIVDEYYEMGKALAQA